MEKYLNEASVERYTKLISKLGPLSAEEREELRGLMDRLLARQVEVLGRTQHTPFEGKCRRCGKEFDDPVPEVTEPEGRYEIATKEWCAECNAFAMSVLLRWASAYRVKHPIDPVRGGSRHASA